MPATIWLGMLLKMKPLCGCCILHCMPCLWQWQWSLHGQIPFWSPGTGATSPSPSIIIHDHPSPFRRQSVWQLRTSGCVRNPTAILHPSEGARKLENHGYGWLRVWLYDQMRQSSSTVPTSSLSPACDACNPVQWIQQVAILAVHLTTPKVKQAGSFNATRR